MMYISEFYILNEMNTNLSTKEKIINKWNYIINSINEKYDKKIDEIIEKEKLRNFMKNKYMKGAIVAGGVIATGASIYYGNKLVKHLLSKKEEEIKKAEIKKQEEIKEKIFDNKEKYILTIVINVKHEELMKELQSTNYLTYQTAKKLAEFHKWLLYSTEERWKNTCQKLFENPRQEQDEDDVYYIKITLDSPDNRFKGESGKVNMYNALIELGQKNYKVEVSERQPKESYENKGFYRV